jgi:hypothetical protein
MRTRLKHFELARPEFFFAAFLSRFSATFTRHKPVLMELGVAILSWLITYYTAQAPVPLSAWQYASLSVSGLQDT